jgi:hypothetical protein
MKKRSHIFLLALNILFFVLAGCSSNSGIEQLEIVNDFSESDDGWESGFADLPSGKKADFELESGRKELPSGIDGFGMYLQGHNRSDDLFMYLTKQVTDLKPSTTFRVTFNIDLVTNVPSGWMGIGGAPGESVYLKVGASDHQPIVEDNGNGFLELNVDKGYQSNGGSEMFVIGNVASEDVMDETHFVIKSLFDEGFEFTSDEDGNLWLIIGTDSGFEGLTTLYYSQIQVFMTAIPVE